jgi:hypothetical protein
MVSRMSCDKLILLSSEIRRSFLREAESNGEPKWGYGAFLDLTKAPNPLPAKLYCHGRRNGIHKIEFVNVSRLGLAKARFVVTKLLPEGARAKITRIDWCVDLPHIPISEVAASCIAIGAQNCAYHRSRNGCSFYPQKSHQRSLLIYEKLKRARARHEEFARRFPGATEVTRFEVQLRGRGVPIRPFERLSEYARLDLLENVKFVHFRIPVGLGAMERLAARALKVCASEVGIQRLSKCFSGNEWLKIRSKLLSQSSVPGLPDIHTLFQESKREWLERPIRFPRLANSERVDNGVLGR